MRSDNVAIKVMNVSKDFHIYADKANTLKERIIRLVNGKKEVRTVLKNIDFKINKGETVALIGINGSGKSTLLKLITKIIYPSKGKITTCGKVSSLLELGAGFHPDFSGRENIYFNASIFGLSKSEIDERLDDIIKFSELEEFIDTPIRTYSSGMYMRLAFSVAINVDADILLIDEILAVGDQKFQEKCIDKMLELKKKGKTMVFVSHSAEAVKMLCDRAIWLLDGKIQMDGGTEKVLEAYTKKLNGEE
ncbi:MAG: ABC transporter ATP-binding protein [Bacilli bacterium]|nr:ABC transporter ATP-binding protein [Bacilli bacterium]